MLTNGMTLQVDLLRARRNFDLWYGGVPWLVLELPSTLHCLMSLGTTLLHRRLSTTCSSCRYFDGLNMLGFRGGGTEGGDCPNHPPWCPDHLPGSNYLHNFYFLQLITLETSGILPSSIPALPVHLVTQVLNAVRGGYDVGPEASRLIIHQDGDRETFEDWESSIGFATKNVGRLFAKACMQHGEPDAARLLKLLAYPSNISTSSRDPFFVDLMHPILCLGGSFMYKLVDVPPCNSLPMSGGQQGRRPTAEENNILQAALLRAAEAEAEGSSPSKPMLLTVPPLEEEVFTSGERDDIGSFRNAAMQCASPCYLRPDTDAHPAIDACIWPDTLLNFKSAVGKTDSPDEVVLERHLECLPDSPRYYLDYFVPANVYSTFKPAMLKRHAASFPRASRTYVRVVKAKASLRTTTVPAAMQLKCVVHAAHGARRLLAHFI